MTDVDAQIGLEGIRAELHDEAVPIEDVTPYAGNARRGDLPKIKTSLLKHGQYKPLLVQKSSGNIVAGNNTYTAMRELGYTHVAVKVLDVDDVKAREMLLIDNASSDDAIYDDSALAALLADVEDWDATGWTPDDLDDVLSALSEQAGDPEKLAAALPPAAAALTPTVLPTVPATDARYGETPEDEQARQEKFNGWTPRYAKGMTEVILVYPEDVRTQVLELIEKGKAQLGGGLRNGDVVRGALLLLSEVIDAHRRTDLALDIGRALEIAVPPAEAEEQAAAAAEAEQAAAAETAPSAEQATDS